MKDKTLDGYYYDGKNLYELWIDEDGNGIFPIAIQASGGGDIANVSAIVVDAIPGN